jgi:hypothetical protein
MSDLKKKQKQAKNKNSEKKKKKSSYALILIHDSGTARINAFLTSMRYSSPDMVT